MSNKIQAAKASATKAQEAVQNAKQALYDQDEAAIAWFMEAARKEFNAAGRAGRQSERKCSGGVCTVDWHPTRPQ